MPLRTAHLSMPNAQEGTPILVSRGAGGFVLGAPPATFIVQDGTSSENQVPHSHLY